MGLTDSEYTKKVDNKTYKNFIKDKAGYGLAQWTFWSRKEKLYNHAQKRKKSIGDLEMQLSYLIDELKSSYKSLFELLCKTNSIE